MTNQSKTDGHKRKSKLEISRAIKDYIKGMTLSEVAKKYGVSEPSAYMWLKKSGVEIRGRRSNNWEKTKKMVKRFELKTKKLPNFFYGIGKSGLTTDLSEKLNTEVAVANQSKTEEQGWETRFDDLVFGQLYSFPFSVERTEGWMKINKKPVRIVGMAVNNDDIKELIQYELATQKADIIESIEAWVEKTDIFIEASDDDGHRYQIPASKEVEWEAFRDIPEDDERSWDVPEWAERIDGQRIVQHGINDLLTHLKEIKETDKEGV